MSLARDRQFLQLSSSPLAPLATASKTDVAAIRNARIKCQASEPPSTTTACPVIHAAAFEARNTAAPAMSSGSPRRRSGVPLLERFSASGVSHRSEEHTSEIQ